MASKKRFLAVTAIALAIVVACFLLTSATEVLAISSNDKIVVHKSAGECFTVKLIFRNAGSSQNSWSVNVAFEGDSWNWAGSAQNLTLNGYESKTLTWTGTVPANASANSIARLVVYYNDSFKALNYWIFVPSQPDLSVSARVW
jgi:hypothetical protein